MVKIADRLFKLSENGTNLRTELLAGVTTFLTMSYIIFVQPAVLSRDFLGQPTGLDPGSILLATCLVAALSSIFMGFYTKYPIALAPGMGENFFFVSVIMSLTSLGFPHPWQTALGIVFIAGILFLLLSVLKIRKIIIDSVTPSLRSAIAAGIGLFIAFIGLRNGGIIIDKPGTLIGLTDSLLSGDVAVCFTGLVVTASLWVKRTKGSVLWGITVATVMALSLGKISFNGFIGLPEITNHTAFQMDIRSAFSIACIPFIIIFLFMDIFDTTGTLLAVGEQGGFIKNGVFPRANKIFIVDSTGTVIGSLLGTSTVTSYIESTTGIAYGGRTGLTAITTGSLFLFALLFGPLIGMIANYPPITSCALIFVGAIMFGSVSKIEWDDLSESMPAFLIMAGIPLTYSISDGISLGFMTYPMIKLLSGRGDEVKKAMYIIAILLFLYFIFIR